jgi:hypothetical protein
MSVCMSTLSVKNKLFPSFIFVFAMFALSMTAEAATGELINIQFGGTGVYSGDAMGGGSANEYWNRLTRPIGTVSSLKTSTQTASNVNLTWTSDALTTSQWSSFTGQDNTLMSGYIYSSSNDDHLSFTGLVAGATYKLYVYSQSDNTPGNNNGDNQSLSITINGKTYDPTIASEGSTSTFVAGQNYQVYSFISNVTGDNIFYTGSPNGTKGVINGLQLERTASNQRNPAFNPSPNPEPTSMVLLGIGSLVAARKLRKKSK